MRQHLSLLFLAIITVLLGSCSSRDPDPAPEKIRPAKLIKVEAASNERELSFPAVIEALQSAELTFQIAGEIRELNILEGSDVRQGDVIAKLDQRDARNRLAQAQAEYENFEAEFERAERLFAQDAISKSVLDTRRTQRDVAKASLGSARKALSDTVLRAPFSGSISRVFARQFQNVQAKEAIVILQSAEVEAVVNVPGTIVARSEQLQNIETRVVLDAAPDVPLIAQFKEASGVADQATQTYSISFTFTPPADLVILPGMTATIESDLLFENAADIVAAGIAVPIAAILSEGDEQFVWLVSDSGSISKTRVTVAGDLGNSVTVIDGLIGGETIISAGVNFFHEGMKVRPWSPD